MVSDVAVCLLVSRLTVGQWCCCLSACVKAHGGSVMLLSVCLCQGSQWVSDVAVCLLVSGLTVVSDVAICLLVSRLTVGQ